MKIWKYDGLAKLSIRSFPRKDRIVKAGYCPQDAQSYYGSLLTLQRHMFSTTKTFPCEKQKVKCLRVFLWFERMFLKKGSAYQSRLCVNIAVEVDFKVYFEFCYKVLKGTFA